MAGLTEDPASADTELPDGQLPAGAVASTFTAGDLVGERYRIVCFIAAGGMGEVYEAHDEALDEDIALKTVRSDVARDEAALALFKREIQLARKVTHPNVCRIHDVGFHGAGPRRTAFLTMELLHGPTLARRISQQGRLSPREVLPIARQLAAALDAAHRAGVIHRDFKTGNVVLVPSVEGTRAVVTDFGLAFAPAGARDPAGSATAILGTPAYMAPEQLAGEEITPAVDVFSLGVVLYEMLTGSKPFEGALRTPSRPLGALGGVDPRWEAALGRCLALDRRQRFASPGEAVAALADEGPLAASA